MWLEWNEQEERGSWWPCRGRQEPDHVESMLLTMMRNFYFIPNLMRSHWKVLSRERDDMTYAFKDHCLHMEYHLWGGKSRKEQTSQEASAVIQARDGGGLAEFIGMAGGEKWLNAGYLEKRQPIGLTSGIAVDVRGERNVGWLPRVWPMKLGIQWYVLMKWVRTSWGVVVEIKYFGLDVSWRCLLNIKNRLGQDWSTWKSPSQRQYLSISLLFPSP